MWALELLDPSGAPAPAATREVMRGCRGRGVLVLAGGPSGNVLQITPPLVIEEDDWAFALEALSGALADTE
jgi:4-aminobutyrate aminotransferase-like enzyme